MRHAKRYLYLAHRWLGIVLCGFFVMWFASGIVMMYVGYPRLTEAERLQHLPALSAQAGLLAPAEALARAGVAGPLRELRLAVASGGRPVYLVVEKAAPTGAAPPAPARAAPGRGTVVIDAASGERLTRFDADWALRSAAAFAAARGEATPRYLDSVMEDAFTHSRALDAHRPLHRLQLGDATDTRVYVSSLTGEVVREATRHERLWNYAGAWIHWLYPFRGNLFDRYWADIVNGLSLLGIALALSGTAIGLMRWRFRRPYRSGARTPYAGRLMRWHHVGGLLFALVTLSWIFSGLMSMNPWRIFDSGAPALRTQALQGGELQPGPADAAPAALLAAAGGPVRELRWVQVLGQGVVQARGSAGRPTLLHAQSTQALALDTEALRGAIAGLLDAPVRRVDTLTAHDLYYYAREPHTMTGGNERPLPVLRAVFDDLAATWVYLDPHTGAVVARSDRLRRLSRWLFALLHSWDWLPLLERRPLWDALLIAFSVGGGVLSATGLVIGWRRLRRPWKRHAAA